MEKTFLTAGVDISNDITQLAYWRSGEKGPVMLEAKDLGEGMSWQTVEVKTDDELGAFSDFIKQVITEALEIIGAEAFDVVVFTMQEVTARLMEAIRNGLKSAFAAPAKLIFITHEESCAHYSINQKRELRVNDVAFFDLSRVGFFYNKMHVSNSGNKMNVLVTQKDCSGTVNMDLFNSDEMKHLMDENFKALLMGLLEKQQVSTVYLMGEGFDNEEWATESLNMLCKKRRVFKGRNLYAIGACYMSAQGYFENAASNYRVFCKGRTIHETCIEVIYNNERSEAILVPAAKLWYEVDNSVEGILSGVNKLTISTHSYLGKEILKEEVSLEEFGEYEDRMSRIQITSHMDNCEELLISFRNLGFGEFAPESSVLIERRTKNVL